MIKQYLECGKVVTTHGIAGEVKVQPWCDSPDELLGLDILYLEGGKKAVQVERSREHKSMVLLKLEGINTVEQAATLRNRVLYLNRDDLLLGQDEYFIQDLLGVEVIDADTRTVYGTLSDVTRTGANDVYHLTCPDGSIKLVPAIPQVVIETNLQENVIRIRPLRGLFEDED